MLNKPLLVIVYQTTMKAVRLVKSTFRIWAPISRIVIVLKLPPTQFYLGIWAPKRAEIELNRCSWFR